MKTVSYMLDGVEIEIPIYEIERETPEIYIEHKPPVNTPADPDGSVRLVIDEYTKEIFYKIKIGDEWIDICQLDDETYDGLVDETYEYN